ITRRSRLDEAAKSAGVTDRIDIRALNVTNFEAMPEFVSQVIRDYKRIDVLINNAGFAVAGFIEDLALEEIRSQLETNFFGHVAMTKAVLPFMRQQRSGHIIMLSSIGGLTASPTLSSYSASKFALEGWTEALRLELNALGIKVVLVEPGSFQTDIWTRNSEIAKKARNGSSPNRERGERMRDRVQSLHKKDPIVVARAIAGIAQDANPKLRYLVGNDARLQLWMKRMLPWKWHEKVIARVLKID
ncbi:MAG TPA: SDR family NAD(P)-dependent oxidoreductase, partial [Terriglobales bacterium]|nr:SDR family NAD(P)-dependent oxidoreductase [Terriglobales bacterium]